MSEKINSNEISVIVQGPVSETETLKCLKSVRRHLPEAEIILSTWEGSDISSFDGLYDILVENKDPGNALLRENAGKKLYNNLNRQLLSTQEGLKKASRKYAMKLRSDMILADDRFLNSFDRFQKHSENYVLFKHKILTCSLFTRFYIYCSAIDKKILIPFHISDWWFFGLKEDIDKYFLETEPVKEPDFSTYFSFEENKNKPNPYGKVKIKFAPEQYFGYSCFSRNFKDIYMQDSADFNDELCEKARQCLVNNFVILEFKHSGIYLNKYPYSKNEIMTGDQYMDLYNFYRYESEYKKYCDNDYIITSDKQLFENEKLSYQYLKIYKHFYKSFDKSLPLHTRLEQMFFGIPASIIKYLILLAKSKF